jgi:hypothetical protein
VDKAGATVVPTSTAGAGPEGFAAFPDEEFVDGHQATFRYAPFDDDR